MINHQEAKGYAQERRFYSPGYDDLQNSSSFRYFRATIFWKPECDQQYGRKNKVLGFSVLKVRVATV